MAVWPRFAVLSLRPSAWAQAGPAAPRGHSSRGSLVPPLWPADAGHSGGAAACHRGRSAEQVPHAAMRATARTGTTHASIPSGAATGLLAAWLTRCGESGPPPSAARSFLRRSTNAVLSLPLRPSPRSAESNAVRGEQRRIYLIPSSRRRLLALFDLTIHQSDRQLPRSRPPPHALDP